MNIFITSDTHGDLSHVLEMYDAIISENTPDGVPHIDSFDCMIHCGDYKKDAFELGKKLGLEVYSAFGNCDGSWEPDFDVLDTEAGSIVVTHGHIEDINNTHDKLFALALDQDCNCVCYGHSHIASYREENGCLLINPGSPTKPLDGTEGSCAILTADENGYHGQIVYYSAIKHEESVTPVDSDGGADKKRKASSDQTAKKKKNSTGGFLRRIFNYSDGQ